MTGSILQLVAYGIEDIFLTNEPQITYFKVVYKRHTNFSREEIRQNFSQKPDFNSQISAIISRNADLMEKSYLVITLPEIKKSTDNITKYAWVRNIGYSLIDTISIEINNRQICKHYGEWMYLWNEMFNQKAKENSFKKMIGDIPELTDFTFYKNSYKLYVPLQFWFCRSSANSLPLVSLEYSDIKINLSIKDWDECLITAPSHYIVCSDNLVNFEDYEYIEQNVDGAISSGIFLDFDPYTKRLYYNLISINNFMSPQNINIKNKYKIYGKSFNSNATPAVKSSESLVINPSTYKSTNKIKSLSLGDTYLLINYIFIDDDERIRFAQSKHDYIIEQIFYTEYNEVTGPTESIKINIDNPCRYIVWLLQQKYLYDSKDYYNYTSTYRHKRKYDTYENNIIINDPLYNFDDELIKTETILCNEKERLSYRDSKYFQFNQMYEKCINTPPSGVNAYFFSLDPTSLQHNGTYNMSKVERIDIKIKTNSILSANNIGLFRCYAESYNILRIGNGLGGLLFER
jgi:hypothetical protein